MTPRRDELALDADVEALDGEEFRHAAEHAARQKLERGVGRLIGEALRLARLHLVEQARKARIGRVRLDAEPLQLGEQVRAAGLIGDQNGALVADALGRDMLVGARVLGERGGVDARLGGEGRGADIGRVPVRRAVEQFVEGARDRG